MSKTKVHIDINGSITEIAFRLNAQLMAQYDVEFLKHPLSEHWCIFSNALNQQFELNFMKDLIGFAGLLRSLLDNESIKIPINNEIGFDQHVGVLNIGTTDEQLSLREGCNKIIHAETYCIDFLYSDNHPLANGKNGYDSEGKQFRNPIIRTFGSYHGKSWTSKLNFLRFIDLALNIPE